MACCPISVNSAEQEKIKTNEPIGVRGLCTDEVMVWISREGAQSMTAEGKN